MSSAGTTLPGNAWLSSKAPNYVSFKDNDDEGIERDPGMRKPSVSVRYDPDRPGGTIFQGRTFNTFKKSKEPKKKKSWFSGLKKQSVRFSDQELEPEYGDREVVTSTMGGVTVTTTKPYETVIAERDALLETDAAYRRRIADLEEEKTQILLDYDILFKENNILRDKIEKGDDNRIESFQRVYEDRQILREAETVYKKRISQLEQNEKEMLKNFESLYSENKMLRDKGKTLEDRLNAIDRLDDIKKINELEKKVKQLEKTARTIGYEREELLKEKHELENQMYKLREDVSDLNRNNMVLERENEGLKRGFMALGEKADSGWKDGLKQKTRRQEEEERIMREEHKQFQVQIRELENVTHQLEKTNIELKTKTEMLNTANDNYQTQITDLMKEQRQRTPSAAKRKAQEEAEQREKKVEELRDKVESLKAENMQLTTKNDMLNKEKEGFDKRLDEMSKTPRETASSIRRKMETEREIRDLQTHVENFKEKAKRLEVENQDLKEQGKQMEVEIKANKQAAKELASDQANQKEGQVKELNESIIGLNEEIKTLTEENLKLKAELGATKDKLQDKIESLTKAKEELESEKVTLQETMNNTTSTKANQIQELEDKVNDYQVELKILRPKYEELEQNMEKLKTENQALNDTIEDKRSKIENMKDILRKDKDVFNELASAQRETVNMKREIEELNNKARNERMKMESDLEELLKNQEFMNTALAEHKIRLDMLQEEKNELKAENVQLVKANERQAKTIVDLQVDMDKASNEGITVAKSLRDELNKLEKEHKQMEISLVQAKQELEVAKNEKENQVNKLIKEMDQLKRERETETKQLKEQSDNLQAEVVRLKMFEEKMSEMEGDLKQFINKLNESEGRNKQITDKNLLSMHQVIKEMKSENLQNRLRAAEREENELEKYRMELEIKQDAINEIRKLKDENNRLMGLLDDKKAAEDAQDEWTRKRNKFNEIVNQNKRLEAENKRILTLNEQLQADNLRKELQTKTEHIKLLEGQRQQFSIENAKLKQEISEKDVEIRTIETKVDKSNKAEKENKKLHAENQRLQGEINKRDHMISQLKELETTKAKYLDSSANNQRLYEENKRLRDQIEKTNDYKSQLSRAKDQEKTTAVQHAKYAEENTLLRKMLQDKETQLNREVELQKDRANNILARNKRLISEMANLKNDLSKKDEIIIKLRDLEAESGKYKDANSTISRLHDENQRLRNLLESMSSSGWKSNFTNAKSLASDGYKDPRLQQQAVYVDSKVKRAKSSAEKTGKTEKQESPKEPKKERSRSSKEASLSQESTAMSDEGKIGSKLKIKPLMKLPDIHKEQSVSLYGGTYSELHRKYTLLRRDSKTERLNDELLHIRSALNRTENDKEHVNKQLAEQTAANRKLEEEVSDLKAEINRLKQDTEVKAIGKGLTKVPKLQQQNKRLMGENQRLREELSIRESELLSQQPLGYTVAQYLDTNKSRTTQPKEAPKDDGKPTAKEQKLAKQVETLRMELKQKNETINALGETEKDKIKLMLANNRRLADENARLRAALDESQHVEDDRFTDQRVAGTVIEGVRNAGQQNWASRTDSKPQKQVAFAPNLTDDSKLKLEDIVD